MNFEHYAVKKLEYMSTLFLHTRVKHAYNVLVQEDSRSIEPK